MNLTEVAYYTRRIIKWFAIALGILFFLLIVWKPLIKIKNFIIPPLPAKPTVQFGILPALPLNKFPKSKEIQFILQTPTGELPKDLPKIGKVYLMPVLKPSLFDLDRAKRIAKILGFSPNPQEITDVVYRFKHPDSPAVLDINIVNQTFAISYDLAEDQKLLSLRPRSEKEAVEAVKTFLSTTGFYPDDLQEGQVTTQLLKVEGGEIREAIALSEANFVKVNFFRKDYDGLPVISANPLQSTVWFVVAGRTQNNIIAGEYHYFPIDETQSSTYPLKSVKQAWNELIEGKGYILNGADQTQAIIRRIQLVYLDLGQPQQFLQPVYVFEDAEGGKTIRAIVPAVSEKYYGASQQNN